MNTENKTGVDNGKCEVCGACGHSLCCPPTDCKMTMSSDYCQQCLKDLQRTYDCYTKLIKLLYDAENEAPKDLLNKVKEIHEETFDIDYDD